jgi:hypothetical protein
VLKGGNKTSERGTKEEHEMLVDRYEAEDVFARVPRMVERIDPVVMATSYIRSESR